MDLKTIIKKARDIKDNSVKSYIISLTKLNDNKPIEDLEFLKDKEAIKQKLNDLALTTRKNRITAIIVALGAVDKDKYEEILLNVKDDSSKLEDALNEFRDEKIIGECKDIVNQYFNKSIESIYSLKNYELFPVLENINNFLMNRSN